MDPKSFATTPFGKVIKTPGRHGFWCFVPEPIPRQLDLSTDTVMALSEADTALGRLAGAGRLLPNPHILVNPYIAREAVASSRIEGTQASLSDVFQAEAAGRNPPGSDVIEVQNYIRAMSQGLRRLSTLPLCLRLLREIHAVLLRDVRGRDLQPGEFRRTPNWIGSANDRPETAIFVPPPPEHMTTVLNDLERFMHDDASLPVLVRCALLHYQFETIHPFLDGNGRLGRLLIVFYLVEQGRLPEPLLYISTFLEENRREYYERLQAVRERGEIQEWMQFFLRAVAVQANDAVEKAERLADIRENYRRGLTATRSRASEVIDLMLENPVISVARVVDALDVTSQGARNLIRQIEEQGWLYNAGIVGRGTRHYWVAHEIYDAIEGPFRSVDSGPDQVTGSPS